MRIIAFAIGVLIGLTATAAADPIVNINSRGEKIRAVFLRHQGPPKGAVILLAGGNGRLDITANGTITKLSGNQLVRTRAMYRARGYDTLVPDLAPDMKVGSDGVLNGYRVSLNYANDVGAMIAFLRARTNGPVVVIGTSRGSGGAANAVAKLAPRKDPDGVVYTSAYLKLDCSDLINLWCLTNNTPALLKRPTLVVWHRQDGCEDTPPSAVGPFQRWWQGGTRLVLAKKPFTGGDPPQSDACEAKSPHGFWGLDPQVVNAITAWIASLR